MVHFLYIITKLKEKSNSWYQISLHPTSFSHYSTGGLNNIPILYMNPVPGLGCTLPPPPSLPLLHGVSELARPPASRGLVSVIPKTSESRPKITNQRLPRCVAFKTLGSHCGSLEVEGRGQGGLLGLVGVHTCKTCVNTGLQFTRRRAECRLQWCRCRYVADA